MPGINPISPFVPSRPNSQLQQTPTAAVQPAKRRRTDLPPTGPVNQPTATSTGETDAHGTPALPQLIDRVNRLRSTLPTALLLHLASFFTAEEVSMLRGPEEGLSTLREISQSELFSPTTETLRSWQQNGAPSWLQDVRRIACASVDTGTGSRDLEWLVQTLPNLSELHFIDVGDTGVDLGLLHGLPLQSLTLTLGALPSGLHGLPTTLKILELRGLGATTIGGRVDGLSSDADSPDNLLVNLQSLIASRCLLTNEQMTQLGRLPLTHLDLRPKLFRQPMNAEALAALPQSLVRLTLDDIEDLNLLNRLGQLTHLELDHCSSLRSLDGLPRQLKSLEMRDLEIAFSEYQKLANCTGLQSLALDTRDPKGLEQALEQLPVSLRQLNLRNTGFRYQGLCEPSILLPLTRLTNLETIACNGYFEKAARTLIETHMPSVELEVQRDY